MKISKNARALFARLTDKPTPAETQPTKVTARLESAGEGICSYCSQPMRKSMAANLDVWLCDHDRNVVPVKS